MKKLYFTAKEAKALGVQRAVLHYYVKTGVLIRMAKGVYRDSSYESTAFQWEDLIEAVSSVPGGVICLISALAIYELTDELPRQHWIAVKNSTYIHRSSDYKIMRFRNLTLGKIEIKLEGVLVPIFDRERTIIDAFRLLSLEIAIKALKMALKPHRGKEKIDFIKLQKYAKLLRVSIHPYLMAVTT